MAKSKGQRTFNIAVRFTFGVFFITLTTGALTFLLIGILYACGANLRNINPLLLVVIAVLPSIILGTVSAFFFGRRSFRNLNSVLSAVNEIGKGNFDIEISGIRRPETISEIAQSINIMAKQLKEVEVLREDFIQNFSHEFKTPIVSIQGFAGRLLAGGLEKSEQLECLKIIHEESSRLATLATSTLTMTKLEGATRLEAGEFMLDEQLRRCVLLLEKQWEKKNIEVVMDELPAMPCQGNEEMLKQVWINLLSNAVKFTGEGGRVCLSAALTGNNYTVTVSDNGIGMSEETAARIFDKYYQAKGSRALEGNGLGLAIVKKIISLSGGTISVKSEPGLGSEFTVTLPKGQNSMYNV